MSKSNFSWRQTGQSLTRILIRIRICFGLAPWIRIRIEEKSWIRIRIETTADPQHCVVILAYQVNRPIVLIGRVLHIESNADDPDSNRYNWIRNRSPDLKAKKEKKEKNWRNVIFWRAGCSPLEPRNLHTENNFFSFVLKRPIWMSNKPGSMDPQ